MNTITTAPHAGVSAGDPLVTLDALQLRAMADAAASLRRPSGGADPYYVAERETERGGWRLKIEPPARSGPPPDSLFELDTLEVTPRPVPSQVKITCEGRSRELAKEFDAVFWSEASVEKFIFPYYASKSMWEAAAMLAKISYYWYGFSPPLTFGDVVTEGAPYAVAHTPDSDWAVLDVDSDLHLLFKTVDGRECALLLSKLDDPPSGWRPPRAGEGRGRRTPAGPGAA